MFLRKHWKIASVVALVLVSLLFSEGFRRTVLRRHAVAATRAELDALNREAALLKKEIARLESDSTVIEEYVRKDLGYLRPGEKEVRFVDR